MNSVPLFAAYAPCVPCFVVPSQHAAQRAAQRAAHTEVPSQPVVIVKDLREGLAVTGTILVLSVVIVAGMEALSRRWR